MQLLFLCGYWISSAVAHSLPLLSQFAVSSQLDMVFLKALVCSDGLSRLVDLLVSL